MNYIVPGVLPKLGLSLEVEGVLPFVPVDPGVEPVDDPVEPKFELGVERGVDPVEPKLVPVDEPGVFPRPALVEPVPMPVVPVEVERPPAGGS